MTLSLPQHPCTGHRSFRVFALLLSCVLPMAFAYAQAPAVSYTSPQTAYIGKPLTPITINNTGGAVPSHYNPQSVPLITTSYASEPFVQGAAGDVYTYINYQLFHIDASGNSTLLAGSRTSGSVDGTGSAAGFDYVEDMAIDASGTIYTLEDNYYDVMNCQVRKVTPDGKVITFAGGLRSPTAMTIGSNGIIYVSEGTGRIMKIAADGTTSLLAGQLAYGKADGTGALASFNNPQGLTTDQAGNVYVADFGNSLIRKITPDGKVTTLAGSAAWGAKDGIGTAASFFNPRNVACDSKGNIIVSDQNNYLIRNIAPDGTVTTLAGPMIYDTNNRPTWNSVPNRFILDKNDNIIYAGGYSGQYAKLITTGYSISPDLPQGLTFNTDGSITGTPSVLSSPQSYTIRAVNASGVATTVLNLQVAISSDPPVINAFTPPTGGASAQVDITGNYFTGVTGVTIGGKPAGSFWINSPTSIGATVAPDAGGNTITITNPYGTATATGFTFIPSPVITAISPATGWKGATITITGTDLAGATNVQIGNSYAASYTVVSPTEIIATVGNASSGSIYLYTPGGSATFPGFTFINPPAISSVSPGSAAKGGTVTITGANFTNATAVKFGGTDAASFTVVSPTTITATLGAGTSGTVSVTTVAGTGTWNTFSYIDPPVITGVSPLSAGTGSYVTISGTGLANATISIGGVPAYVLYSGANQLTAIVGNGASSGDVVVTTSAGSATTSGFVFIAAPQISSFTPATAGQGDIVTITGSNFNSVSGVYFGNVGAAFTVISPTSIKATVGYGATGAVQVMTPGGIASAAGFVHTGPVISSFTPTSAGPGQVVTINGSNFTGTNEVDFGGIPATSFSVLSDTQLTAIVGSGASGYLTVITPKGKAQASGFIHPGPAILNVFSNYAGPLSTAPVQINGSNFNNVTSVTFGGVPAASYTVLSPYNISASPSNGASGDIVVTTTSGSGKYTGFIWVQPPTITQVTPLTQQAGGAITITGTNFTGVTAVTLGGVPAQIYNGTPTTFTVIAGKGASGDVSVTTVGGTATFSGFTYTSPILQSISPAIAGAGQTVTLNGSNLDGVQSVKFGNTNAASFTIVSPQQITAVVASGTSGTVTVSGTKGSASIDGFTFLPPPVITLFTPTEGGAGTTVSINGYNLTTASSVTIGGTAATILSVNANQVQVKAGNGASGKVSLTTVAGTAELDGFTWYPAPKITSASPLAANDKTVVTIDGANFDKVTYVQFGGTYVNFTVVSPTRITATPTFGASGAITVTTPGGTASLSGFVYLPEPTISSFTVNGTGQGATVTINGTNFNQVSDVEFGGVAAKSFTAVSPTLVTAIVGSGATGPITLTANGGTASINGFLYLSPPQVSSFLPLSGPVGSTLTISGDHFNTNAAKNAVYIGPVQVTVTSATKTQLTLTVPAAATGPIIVEDLDTRLSGYANLPFTVTNTSGKASFSGKLALNFSSLPSRYMVEDMDGDGKPDLLIAKDDSLYILRNSGDKILSQASFAEKIDLHLARYVQSMAVGDVDGDGKKDILVSIANSVIFLHNTSSSTLSFAGQYLNKVRNSLDGMLLRDINLDGRPDLVIGGPDPVYYPNTTPPGGQVSFGPGVYLANTSSSSNISFAIADIDGDGRPDPVNGSSYSGFSVFQNRSVPGSLSASDFQTDYFSNPGYYYTPYTLQATDLDGDGKPDILENDFAASNFLVYRNTSSAGTISLTGPKSFNSGYSMQNGPVVADLDGDGKPDLVSSSVYQIYFSANQSAPGNVAFAGAAAVISGASSDYLSNYQFADFDGDGRQDIILADNYHSRLLIYSNSPPAIPVITAFSPQAAGKGQKVYITGKYFDGATSVKFGGKAAASFAVTAPGTIEAILADGNSGSVSVQTPVDSASLAGFTFIGAPSITSVVLPSNGSTVVTINGSNFTGVTGVALDGIAATGITVLSNTSISATLSTIAAGTLTVTNPSGQASYVIQLNAAAVISFPAIAAKTYGDQDFELAVSSTNTATPLSFSLSDPAIASISGSTLHILKAGTVTITASQAAAGYYQAAATVSQVLTVQKKALLAKPDDASRPYNQPNPAFTISYTGFAGNESETDLQQKPLVTTTAIQGSPAGSYDLLASGGISANYSITYVNGTLTITPAQDNFKVAATSVTCRGESDGAISVTAVQSASYTAVLSGNGQSKTLPFTSSLNIPGLAPGSYSVCISETSLADFQQCFKLNITQPQDLSVYADVNKVNNIVTLNLDGGNNYTITINNKAYSTSSQAITLPLDRGVNKLSVTADKLCQGLFEQTINTGFVPYPNPFESALYIDLGGKPLSGNLKVYSMSDGTLKLGQSFSNKTGVISLDLSALGVGAYSLYINADNKESVYKIVKQ